MKVVEVKNAGLVAVHGEAHLAGRRGVANQRLSDRRLEEVVAHDQEEGSITGVLLGGEGAGTVAQLPAPRFGQPYHQAPAAGDVR